MSELKNELINSLANCHIDSINELGEKYTAVQILPELKRKYPIQLRPEIVSVRFYQTEKACYFEITEDMNPIGEEFYTQEDLQIRANYSRKDFKTIRTSLAFYANEEGPVHSPTVPVLENAVQFLQDNDDWSLLNITDLFTEKGIAELLSNKENSIK